MRYYQIKRGKEDIFGSVIQVDPEEFLLEHKVKNFMGDISIKYVKSTRDMICYEGNLDDINLGISLDKEENIGLHIKDLKNIEIYLSEISQQEAESLKETIRKWQLYQKLDMD